MYYIEDGRRKKIYEMVSIVKLISFFFCGIIAIGMFPMGKDSGLQINDSFINIITIGIVCMGIIMIIYQAWILSIKKTKFHEGIRKRDVIETFSFMVIFSILNILSGAHVSQYKFLFLFIIITTTMQFGLKYGLGVAGISSGFILIVDLIALPRDVINDYFETDLILVGVFVLTSWLLGYYVKVEEDYRKKMKDLANMDELTGVYNHRYFQEALNQQIEIFQKKNTPISLLFIDIDYFKAYNDLYGHQQGDEVLKNIGNLLKMNVRNGDMVARYGGEEFGIILPNTSEKNAVILAEDIRSKIEKTPFVGEENLPNKKLTISIGISTLPDKAATKVQLINSADDALYRAKFFNKNRVEIYFSILEELKMDIEEEHIDLVSSIKTLISVINAKDRYTYGHTERVVTYCDLMADYLGLCEEDKKALRYGAYLHDIGKIQVNEEVLNKKMKLTEEEWNMLKKHPENGVEIIKPVDSIKNIMPLILHHHERYDGRGYPDNLAGEEIPYLTRILTVADSFDAMTSNRPYQSRKTYDEAIHELEKCSGGQFDPQIARSFIEMVKQNKNDFDRYY